MNVNGANQANQVNQLLNTPNAGANQQAQNAQVPVAAPVNDPNAPDFGPAGVVETSGNSGRYNADISRMRELWNNHQQQVDSFRRMLESLFNRQAQEAGLAAGTWTPADLEVTEEMQAWAQEQIGEGGYFSVESTASRLLDFAVAISGGDPSRIEVLRNAVEQGFAAAEQAWGGELPGISQQTREAVMNGFDQWAAAGSASAITLLNPAQQAE